MRIPSETSFFLYISKLIYIISTSLDGYVEDETGAFDGPIPIKYTHLSLSCCNQSKCISADGECLRRWPTGRGGGRLPARTMRFRAGLAEGRENRLFANPDGGYDAQDAPRAQLRSRSDSEAQAGLEVRHRHWRTRACGDSDRSRSRRRMPPIRQPDDRQRRKVGIPSRLTTESRTPRDAPFQHRSSPLALSRKKTFA